MILKLLLALSLLIPCAQANQNNIFTGKWQTIDDETNEPKSIVKIFTEDDELKGQIVQLINPEEENPLCNQCPDEKKNQPIEGLEIIWGLKESKENKEWSGGHILDPENGKVYRSRLRIGDDKDILEVRGFIGFSLLGRTQEWVRVYEPNE